MNWLGRLFHRGRLESDLNKELAFHVERQTASYVDAGLSEAEARRTARLAFGAPAQIREECRDARGTLWVERILQDLRVSLRLLRKSPGFTLAALGTLALGIGANTALFRLFDAVRLSVLPIEKPDRLALVDFVNDDGRRGSRLSAYPAITNPVWERLRDSQQTFSGILAWGNTEFNIATAGESRMVRGIYVSGDFFRVLGVRPMMGRLLQQASDHRGCGLPGAVISYGFWQREFGGSRSVVGRTISLNYQRTEIIGVSAPAFTGVEIGRAYDVAVPICSQPVLRPTRSFLDAGTIWWLTVMGRLKPDQTIENAGAQLRTLSHALFEASLPAKYPSESIKDYLNLKLTAKPGGSGVSILREEYSEPLLLLLATAGLVLLIACANLANLSLARSSARAHEFAVRLAIGASRGRLVQQLITEGALLAGGGAALALFLSEVLSRILVRSLGAAGDPPIIDTHLNWRMLAFTTFVACVTCILFGLAPAYESTRRDAAEAMKVNGRTLSANRERFGIRQMLVVTQVALSLVLLVGALLFSGSLRNLLSVDAGFRRDGILVAQVGFSRISTGAKDPTAYKRRLMEQIRVVPGVTSAAVVGNLPLSGAITTNTVWPEATPAALRRDANFSPVGNDYFRTMGIPVLSGRDFNDRDTATSPAVAIVNQTLAQQLGLGANPIGKYFRRQARPSQPEISLEIVGLVKDTKYQSLRDERRPIAFVEIAQDSVDVPFGQIVIHSSASLTGIASGVRSVLAGIDPAINVDFQSFDSVVEEGLVRDRMLAGLSGFFGVLAALIAAVGLYGVTSYAVARRTNEIGLRMALGASRSRILFLMMRQVGTLLAIGLVSGAILSLGATAAAQSMLFGLKSYDPGTLIFGAAMLTSIAIAATYLPAHRAATLEPMKALREE